MLFRSLVEYHDRAIPAEAKSVKRLMCRMSDENILRLMEVQRCDRLAHAPEHAEPPSALREIPILMRAIRDADECLSLKTLQIKGDDLIAMGVPRGKEIGVILNALLEQVIDGALPNDRERLLTAAKGMILY